MSPFHSNYESVVGDNYIGFGCDVKGVEDASTRLGRAVRALCRPPTPRDPCSDQQLMKSSYVAAYLLKGGLGPPPRFCEGLYALRREGRLENVEQLRYNVRMITMRLLCDAMLGRLTTWLRLLGYDTVYSEASDHELARQARADDRVLLTRDTQLTERRGIQALLIESDLLEDQLRQVIREFGLPESDVFSRCPTCNTPLREIPKPAVKNRVPPYVFEHHDSFQECPECEKIYWRGSHWRRIRDQLDALGVEDR